MRHLLLQTLTLLVLIYPSRGAEKTSALPLLDAAELSPNATPAAGPAGQPAIQVIGGAEMSRTTVVNCPAPSIPTDRYVVRGRVKYEHVFGDGYLELLSDFGSKRIFFTRSLAEFGAMRKLKGDSQWRAFELPFFADPGMRPEKLTLNVVLPGVGTVVVTEPTLVVVDTSNQWWSEEQANLYGGIAGGCLGVLGTLIGCLAAWGKMRRLTLVLFTFGLVVGGGALVAGLAAVACRQPWHVYYPLLLVGVIGVGVLGGNLWNLLRRYRADELRRIAAVDA
jgi:hypothetical protein